MLRKCSVVLLVLAYALLLRGPLLDLLHPEAPSHHQMDAAGAPEMAAHAPAVADPWTPTLTAALGVAGIMLAVVPVRRGEAWALWPVLATFLILGGTRLATDPRCLLVLDPHQHGCHTFMLALVLALAGLVLSAFAGKALAAASSR
jgi:hypothetical protein